jgi:4-hydroxy-tetrahydrodipicolinate reductase
VRHKSVVIGTTGLPAAQLAAWRDTAAAQELRLLIAPNTSVGILVALKAAILAATPLVGIGFDVEITETHHRAKVDAPSGTARFLADSLAQAIPELNVVTDRRGARQRGELGVHSVRGGGVFGEHEIRLLGDAEEIRISHRAFSRSLFASGALVLAGWILKQEPGVYGLLDVKAEELNGSLT